MKLMVSTDVPFIKQVSNERYIESVSEHIAKIAKATKAECSFYSLRMKC